MLSNLQTTNFLKGHRADLAFTGLAFRGDSSTFRNGPRNFIHHCGWLEMGSLVFAIT